MSQRKSTRKQKKVKRFNFDDYEKFEDFRSFENPSGKRRRKKEEKTISPSEFKEQISRKISDTITPIIMNNLEMFDMDDDMGKKRANSLLKVFQRGINTFQQGLVFSDNGQFYVTSSDRESTYTIQLIPMGDKLRITCNCGEKYISEERLHCKHIFAVIFFITNTAVGSFCNYSTPKTIKGIHDMTILIEDMKLKKKPMPREDPDRKDFLFLLSSGQKS